MAISPFSVSPKRVFFAILAFGAVLVLYNSLAISPGIAYPDYKYFKGSSKNKYNASAIETTYAPTSAEFSSTSTSAAASASPSIEDDTLAHNTALAEYHLAIEKGLLTTEEIGPFDDHDPVQHLIVRGMLEYHEKSAPNQPSLHDLTAKYIKTHGRLPPPNFDKWYEYALRVNVLNFTDFDRIYDDLRPFWGVAPAKIRGDIYRLCEDGGFAVVDIDAHSAKIVGRAASFGEVPWRPETFIRTIQSFIDFLPNMRIPLSLTDEPRVMVSFDDITRLNAVEQSSRNIPLNYSNQYSDYNYTDSPESDGMQYAPLTWMAERGDPFHTMLGNACPPDSLARVADQPETAREKASKHYLTSLGGFVTDFNASMDMCTIDPYARYLHGYLQYPTTSHVSPELLPVFSECKLNVQNDILYPANMYSSHAETYTYDPSKDFDFFEKKNIAIWRGAPSEGENVKPLLDSFQRHRLVRLFNSSLVSENGPSRYGHICSQNESSSRSNISGLCYSDPHDFLDRYTEIGFTELGWCSADDPDCDVEDQHRHYQVLDMIPFAEVLEYRYLIDQDGRSFSGRFLPFLRSRSLAFKSTIFREWHDSRLIPWAHFIPFDITFDELFALVAYFVGIDETSVPRTSLAKKIGELSQSWAARVLRLDDMDAYKFLLLLEYGRLLDDNRDNIGYVPEGFDLSAYATTNGMESDAIF
ncbi:glycosyltransferase family 90 protein [Tortispora caseinolytica NRRL Y-17796]|uniref:Glycosyltransferase family 90 protein n=1 Tax=Tortispora caseinolytica NRRL Y-17796 TaxID=767744 RepID=A0A1E4TCF4_9ASCO|nr:glycosyltransferase family 90 protein [Tortispora caseinolytica NRRL Y-17796]